MSKFSEARKQRLHWITETQAELAVPDGPFDDGLWRLGYHDTVNGLQVQADLLNEIIAHPEQQTREALTVLLRSLFAKYDDLHAQLATLPNFDHVGDGAEIELIDLPENERAIYDQVEALDHEVFVNMHQHELVAELLNIEDYRRHDLMGIISSYYTSEETQRICQKEEEASYYPLVKHWIDAGGDVMALNIPEKFNAWMRKVSA